MLEWIEANPLLVLAVLVCVAVVLGLDGLYTLWKSWGSSRARRLRDRLRTIAQDEETQQRSVLKKRMVSAVPALEKILALDPRVQWLERRLAQAGLRWTVTRLFLFSLLGGLLLPLLVMASIGAWLLVLLAAAGSGAAFPFLYVEFRRQRRLRQLQLQLPDALDLLNRGLQAGHAFSSALHMISEEMRDPIAGEFSTVHDEVSFGVPLQQALNNLAARVPSTDLRYFVVAVLIQRESGGNLSEILTKLSRLMRERQKLQGRIRVLSSEGRMSAWVLGLMPFALAGLMSWANPEFMAPLWTDPAGHMIIEATLGLMAVGVLILLKIIRIRV